MEKRQKKSSPRFSQSNQKGFALIGILSLTPFLLAIFAAASLWLISLREVNFMNSRCRYQSLVAQEKMAQLLSALLALNPEATRLRGARRLAEHELKVAKATLEPPLILIAETHLAAVLAAQTALRLKQERILFQSRSVRSAVSSRIDNDTQQLKAKSFLRPNSNMGLAVIATPPNDASPDYNLAMPFKERQAIAVDWKFSIHSNLPSWTKNLIQNGNSTGKCGATIQKEGENWQAHLSAVK